MKATHTGKVNGEAFAVFVEEKAMYFRVRFLRGPYKGRTQRIGHNRAKSERSAIRLAAVQLYGCAKRHVRSLKKA